MQQLGLEFGAQTDHNFRRYEKTNKSYGVYMLTSEQMIEMVPRITAQWLAGFFDGEGCVSASKRGPMYSVKVSISQSDPLILSMIALKFNNTTFSSYTSSLSKKPTYAVIWTGRSVLEILEFIKDHVIVKRKQVDAAIKLGYILSKRTTNGKGGNGFTQAEADEREELARIICNDKIRPHAFEASHSKEL